MYSINDKNDTNTYQLCKLKYYKLRMNLLLIYAKEHTNSHYIYIYIYIKKVEILLNISTTSFYKGTNCCTYCNKVVNNDIPYDEHLF